jgi:DNA polymerase-3 subunit delta
VLHIIYGPDSFTARQIVKTLSDQRQQGDIEGPDATVWLEQKSTSPGAVIDACSQGALFGAPPPVILEGLLARFEPSRSGVARGRRSKKKDGPVLGEWDPFPGMVAALPVTSLLILLDGDIKGPNPMLKAIEPHATKTHVMRTPDQGRVAGFVQQKVAAGGGTIAPEAVYNLSTNSNGDLWYVSTEVEKLLMYADGKMITGEMADAMVTGIQSTTIFALVDAIVEGRQDAARHNMDKLYHEGIAAGYVLTMVHRQLRLVAQAKEWSSRSRGSESPKGEFSGLPSFAQERARRQASRFSLPAIRRALTAVIEADRSIKTGISHEQAAMDLLISALSAIVMSR